MWTAGAAMLALGVPAVARAEPLVDDVVPPVVAASLSSPVISPNGDGRHDRVSIRVTVDEPVSLTVRVVRPDGRGSSVLAEERPTETGTSTLVWSGRLRRPGGPWVRAADGRVEIGITATDAAGNTSEVTRRLTVDTHAPRLRVTGLSPEPWSGHGILTHRFAARDVSRPLTMWAQVLRRGHVVDEMVHHARPAGTRSLHWVPQDGRRPLDPGPYEAVVVVRDGAGNTRRSTPRPFRIHRPGSTYVIDRVDGAGRRVGLTIDDCADRDAWQSMLATLDRMDAGATFFCNGDYVRRYTDVARRTVATDRVSIGSHSTDHADLATLSFDQILARLLGDENAWWDVARSTPAPWFRPPYGSYGPTVLAAAGRASFPFTVLWSIDTRDWEGADPGVITSRAVDKAKPGSIILIHAKPRTAEALPAIISRLRAKGLEPVGLPQLTGR